MEIQNIEYPNKNNRIETGVLQIGNDWPGVFIRGDNAIYYAYLLRSFIDNPEDGFNKAMCEQIIELLSSCDIRSINNDRSKDNCRV